MWWWSSRPSDAKGETKESDPRANGRPLSSMTDREILYHLMGEITEIKNHMASKKRERSADKDKRSHKDIVPEKKSKPNPVVDDFAADIRAHYDHALLAREVVALEEAVVRQCRSFLEHPDWDKVPHIVDSQVSRRFRNIWEILKREGFEFPSLYVRLTHTLIQWMVASRVSGVTLQTNLTAVQHLVKHRRNNYRIDAILYLNAKILWYKHPHKMIEGIREFGEEKNTGGAQTQQFHFIVGGGRHLYFSLQLEKSVRVRDLKEWWIHREMTNPISSRSREFMFSFRIDGHTVGDDSLICHLPSKTDHIRVVEILPISLQLSVSTLHIAVMTQTDDVYKLFVNMMNPKYHIDHMPIAFYLDGLSSRFRIHQNSMLFSLLPLIERIVLSKARDIYVTVCESLRSSRTGLTHDLVTVIVNQYLDWHGPPITKLPSDFKWDGKDVVDPNSAHNSKSSSS
jgi:hypothetical protein